MKFNLNFKQKTNNNMLFLYITVGIVFVLITIMNIYTYRVINSMGEDYSQLGVLGKELRHNLELAQTNLTDIVVLGKHKDLKTHVYTHLDEAEKKAKKLSEISNLKLGKNISQFATLAPKAYSEKDPEEKKKLMDQCTREIKNAIDQLNASDEERTALINNETHFISYIYIVLIVSNILAFAGIFFVIFINDRGIRKKEEKLNSVTANFHAIMEGLDSILISFDSNGIVQTWNRNAERYFDLKKDEAVEKNLYEIVPAFKSLKNWFDKALYSQQRQYNFHARVHFNKGPCRIVDILCVPLSSGSRRKEKKALLLKIDDVTTFATDAEHQVRLRCANLISSGMELVVKESSVLNSQANGVLQSINELAAAHGITEEIAPYSAYLNNTLAELSGVPQKYASTLQMNQFNNIKLDLNEQVMYALRICLKIFDPCISVEVSQNESKSWIMADAAMLSRALFCLLNNAAEAMTEMKKEGEPQGGIISVSVEKIEGEKIVCDRIMRFRHAVQEQPYWVVMISDNGVGIPEEIRDSIFDMFFTTKNTDVHKGLGLSVVVNIVNELGGFMDVSSTDGNGSVLKMYLPEMPGAQEETESEQTSNLAGDDSDIVYGQGAVLLVNDDIFMQQITAKLLEKFGYQVVTSDNGFEALDLYAQTINSGEQNFQCVVCNLTRGLIRNVDMVSNLKQMDPQAGVVVLVNSEQDEDVPQLRELGVSDFVKKPYSMPEFSQILAKYAPAEEVQQS